ncbi:UDP-N-acetylmuramate dehydrogenase [Yinghuangia seranimata]|uniref:UDP-N-acetylmuramate dehydrogenase n=1 Tax=Yinghuangia seranimata TaxID=408067 RepID=UPI00248C8C13|nr:UDP-N-acetylmuramate dehydrogenase [Yinghuangia seranimata]MDI2126911.1 UDP-N-acetylmuramate dehydrogenase [Yinghuangia seranimata]
MQHLADSPLAPLTTLRLGGPARRLYEATTTAELVAVVRDADDHGTPLLLIGGGSNLVIGDEGFDGIVVRVATKGHTLSPSGLLSSDAGVRWDHLVETAVDAGLAGVEFLSGVPGSTGATPIQNVGAYGQEVAETISLVEVYDRKTGRMDMLDASECGFSYRDSMFKTPADPADAGRFVVLRVHFQLRDEGGLSAPVRYAEVARVLGVEPGGRVPLATARETVLGLRRGKGMVLDEADHDTWSAGSFFTNPVLTDAEFAALEQRVADRLGADAAAPRYPAGEGHAKTSAAWLIERAGFAKGHGTGPARISTKHTLALTNRGGAKTEDLLALAREVRDGVREAFGVELVNEPVFVGAEL